MIALTWLPRLLRAAPWIVIGLLLAAVLVQRRTVVEVRTRLVMVERERDQVTAALAETVIEPAKRPRTVAPGDAVRAAATYREARVQARLTATATARASEQRQTRATQEIQDALQPRLAAARAAAARHAAATSGRMCAAPAADRGAAGPARDLSRPADPAGAVAGAGEAAELAARSADLAACGEAVIKAEGWQDWWRRVSAPAL